MSRNALLPELQGYSTRAAPALQSNKLSKTQLRTILNALMRNPVEVVNQVGILMMLFVSVVEANSLDAGSLSSARFDGPAKKKSRRIVVTGEERKRAVQLVALMTHRSRSKKGKETAAVVQGRRSVLRKKTCGGRPTSEELRCWAVQRNQKVPQLFRLFDGEKLRLDDAILVRHHADQINVVDATKALAAAARALLYISGATEATLRRPRQAAVTIQGFWRTGRTVRSQWRHDQRFAEVSETARAAVRLQALARGAISRREYEDSKETAADTRTSKARGASVGRWQGRSEAVRRAVATTAEYQIRGYTWGMSLWWRNEALRRSTSAVGIQSVDETASAVGPRRYTTWYCGRSQMDATVLRGSARAQKVPASRMAVANMSQRHDSHRRNKETNTNSDVDAESMGSPPPPPASACTASSESAIHGNSTTPSLLDVPLLHSQPTPSAGATSKAFSAARGGSVRLSTGVHDSGDIAPSPECRRPIHPETARPGAFFVQQSTPGFTGNVTKTSATLGGTTPLEVSGTPPPFHEQGVGRRDDISIDNLLQIAGDLAIKTIGNDAYVPVGSLTTGEYFLAMGLLPSVLDSRERSSVATVSSEGSGLSSARNRPLPSRPPPYRNIHPSPLHETGSDEAESGDTSEGVAKMNDTSTPTLASTSWFNSTSSNNLSSSMGDIELLGPKSTSATHVHAQAVPPREVHLPPALERKPPPLREDNLAPALERTPPPYEDSADRDSGQRSPRSSSVGEASVLRRNDTGDSGSGLIEGILPAAASLVEEVGRASTTCDRNDDAADACMLRSREGGPLRSNSMEVRSEAGSDAHKTSHHTSDGSVDSNDLPAPPESASTISPAPPSPIQNTSSSLLDLGKLGSRSSSSSVQPSEEEFKDYTPFSTPPRRDGHGSDTSISRPFSEASSRAELLKPSPIGRHLPDRAPPAGIRSPSLSTPPLRDGNSSDTSSSSPEHPRSTTPPSRDGVLGVSFSKQQTPLDVTADALFARNNPAIGASLMTSPTGVTRLPSLRLSTLSTTPSSPPERWRRCEGRSSRDVVVERPVGGSRWGSFSGATTASHTVGTPPPLSGWAQATGGVCANLTEEENKRNEPELPTSDADLSASKTNEVIRYSTAARARSFLERARLSAVREQYRDRNSGITVVSKGDRSSKSTPTRLLDEVGSGGTDMVADAQTSTAESSNPQDPDAVSIASSAPSSEDAMNPPLLDIDLPESESMSSDFVNTQEPSAHGGSMRLSTDGSSSADGVRSTSERRQSVCCSPIAEPPTLTFAEKPALRLVVDKMMENWERDTTTGGGVGGQLPTVEEAAAATSLDRGVVRPSSPDSSAHVGEAKGTAADEVQVYGALPLEAPRTPSPSRSHAPYRISSMGTPSSLARTSPSVHSPPRKRRRRKGSSSSAGPGARRPRNLSRSVSAVPDVRYNAISATPPSSPDRLRTDTVDAASAGLADDGGRQGSVPWSFASEAPAFLRSDTSDDSDNSGFIDGTVSAAGSFVEEVGHVSTVYDSDDANAGMLWSLEEGSFRANSLGLISDWDSEFSSGPAPSSTVSLQSAPLSDVGDMDVADINSDWDSEFSSGPAPSSSSTSLPSAPMSDVGSIDV